MIYFWVATCLESPHSLCLPYSVTGDVYCWPRRQLIFISGRRVIYHSKGFGEYIPISIPSICTAIFKRIAGICFYPKSLMLCINGFVSTSSKKQMTSFFQISIFFFFVIQNSKIIKIILLIQEDNKAFHVLTENREFFIRITRLKYWSNCNVIYIEGFFTTSSTN